MYTRETNTSTPQEGNFLCRIQSRRQGFVDCWERLALQECVWTGCLGNPERLSGGRTALGLCLFGPGSCALTSQWQASWSPLSFAPPARSCSALRHHPKGPAWLRLHSQRGPRRSGAVCAAWWVLCPPRQQWTVLRKSPWMWQCLRTWRTCMCFTRGLGVLWHAWFILELLPWAHLGKPLQY